MGASRASERASVDGAAPATLGDILFADRRRATPEGEWVALVRGVAARDERALHALYQRTHRVVFTLVMRILHDVSSAEELTVDVFHDVWRRAGDYDPANGSVAGWILNQARSRAIDRLRFQQRKKRVDPRPPAHEAGSDEDGGAADRPGPYEAAELEELARLLRDALAGLTPDEREAIETTFLAGLTHAETAAHLDQPLGTVKTRIRSGLEKLRQALRESKP